MRNAAGGGPRANDEEDFLPASMLVGLISQEQLTKLYDDNRTDSIGSQDAVMFLNPVECTVENTDISAFEEVLENEAVQISPEQL